MHDFFVKKQEWIADLILKDQAYNIAHAAEPRCGEGKMLIFLSVYKFHSKHE